MAHTPGPWRVHRLGHIESGSVASESHPGEPQVVAMVVNRIQGGYRELPNYRENARLIAAAPDMLGALEVIKEVAQVDESDPVAVRSAFADIIRVAENALKGLA